ncbi:MAG: DinB family protein [Candidatus Thorarchaeota archaeon]
MVDGDMLHSFLRDAIERHFHETSPLIGQLSDDIVLSKPLKEGRELGEIVLHLLRSTEYYMRGLTTEIWDPLPYTVEFYRSSQAIRTLANEVFGRAVDYMNKITPDGLLQVIDSFNHSASVAEIILEMIEHSVHHRGQITVYYRLLGLEPRTIPYSV